MRLLIDESLENMKRVETIIGLHAKVDKADIGTENERSELLRAAVVFLHSSIEEVVRNLFVEFLPKGDTKTLNELSYFGNGLTDRSKGVLFGDLLKNHSGRFVENVIIDCINAHVDRLNINNSEQLVSQLKKVKIDTDTLSPFLDDLDQLMRRRHQIVHQMDRDDKLDPMSRAVTKIDAKTVKKWFGSVLRFNKQIILQLDRLAT
jgi:RiboL-PSP-HEPN